MNKTERKLKRKKLTRKIKTERRKLLNGYAMELNRCLPKSEAWFQSLYKLYQSINDKFNMPLNNKYIPDVINQEDKYIIEVDGSIHTTASQKIRDGKKDIYYRQVGYEVIRVVAYSEASFQEAIDKLLVIRQKNNPYYTHPRKG